MAIFSFIFFCAEVKMMKAMDVAVWMWIEATYTYAHLLSLMHNNNNKISKIKWCSSNSNTHSNLSSRSDIVETPSNAARALVDNKNLFCLFFVWYKTSGERHSMEHSISVALFLKFLKYRQQKCTHKKSLFLNTFLM